MKKERLFENKKIMNETCEGIVLCMNGLFYAYTDELYSLGILGERIAIDFESANAKYEVMLKYETDKEKVFSTIVECLGLYPASREFYEKVEMELEDCPDWKAFKSYWHLEFLYREVETAYLKTCAEVDGKKGYLKLYDNVLVFDVDNSQYSKRVAIGTIRKIEKEKTFFNICLKGKLLMLALETPMDDVWADVLNNAINGKYEKVSIEEIEERLKDKQKEFHEKSEKAKAYILENFSSEEKLRALSYYTSQVGVSASEARVVLDEIFAQLPQNEQKGAYPGIADLSKGLFRGERVILFGGGVSLEYYTILTTKQLIYIDLKKKKEEKYDIYKMSKLKPGVLGLAFSFNYQGSFMIKSVIAPGGQANDYIEKITNMQKGIF